MRRIDSLWGKPRILQLVLALMLTLSAAPGVAQEVTATGRSAGMGEALTAGVSGTSAVWHNPAGVATALMYSAEAGYAYDGASNLNAITANLVDTKSNPRVGAGLGFVYEMGGPKDGTYTEGYHFRGALAFPMLDGLVRIGGTFKYSTVDVDQIETLAAILFDAGIIVQPTESISIGVAGLNLVNGGYDAEMPRKLAAGLAFSSLGLGLHASGDVVFDLSQETPEDARTWRAGLEFLVSGLFPVRAGYAFDELAGQSVVSVGGGFRDKESSIGLDASYQHNLDDPADRVFVGALSVYF